MSSDKEASFLMRLVDMVSGPLKSITNVAGEATKKLNETTGAAAKVGKGGGLGSGGGLGGFFGKIQSSLGGMSSKLREAADEVPGLNRVMSLVTNPYVAIAATVVGLGLALGVATNKAMDFDKGMAQINTTARLSGPDLVQLRNRLLTMGADSTVPLQEIPAAFNQIISAVGDSNKALAIMGPALKASQAGFTDVKTIAEATTNVLGAVGKATPTEVLDTLFASVRLGKGEFKDFASYLPKIIPLANNVSIGYQEVAGAFALMTSKGQTAEQSAMLLQNAMTALGKSEVIYGTKSQAGFQRSGIAIFDHAGKMRKLVDIVGDLTKRTTGMNDQQKQAFLAGLGLDAQAAASFSILSQNSKQLREFVKGTSDSAGEMDEAFKRSLNPADRLKMLSNQWELLMTKIGYKILPYVNDLLEWGLDVVKNIKANSQEWSHYFEATIAPLKIMWSTLKGVYNLVSWISEHTGGSMGSLMEQLFGGSGGMWQEIKGFLDNFFEYIGVAAAAIDDISEGHFKRAGQRFDEFSKKMDIIRRGGIVGEVTGGQSADFNEFFGLATKRDDEQKKGGAGALTTALDKQNKGTSIEGDNSKARIVNTRIDKIEVIVKEAIAGAGQSMGDLGNQIAAAIVGAVRDSEIILSNGN
jgi:TP901 family phage tail tape measure protein